MEIRRAWVAQSTADHLFSISMRIDEGQWDQMKVCSVDPLHLSLPAVLPNHEEPGKRDVHVSLGLLDIEGLRMLRDAIDEGIRKFS